MPYKSEDKAREASKVRMQKMRQGVTKQGVTGEGVTMSNNIHPIVYALADPEKRLKLRAICEALKAKTNRLDSVYYGCGRNMMPFTEVDRLLEAF